MPGSICSIASCRSNALISKKSGDQIRFFTFPKDSSLRREWVRRCFRSDSFNPTNKRICSRHFTSGDFEDEMEAKIQNRLPKILKRDSIPSKNLKPLNEAIVVNEGGIVKKERLARAAKTKQREFIKALIEQEKKTDLMEEEEEEEEKEMDNIAINCGQIGVDALRESEINENIDTSKKRTQVYSSEREEEIEKRITQLFTTKVQILFAEELL